MEIITPPGLTLYPFQKETVIKSIQFLKSTESHSVLVCNSCGLGKTITTLATINTLRFKRVLIVCPAIVRSVWESMIPVWCNTGNTKSYQSICTVYKSIDIKASSASQFVIVSYALTISKEVLTNLTKQHFDYVVYDEFQALKSFKSKRTSAALKHINPIATNHIYLSGTPFVRDILDFFPVLNASLSTAFPSYKLFAERYAYEKYSPFTPTHKVYYGLKNAEELSKILRSNVLVRYRLEYVLPDLPALEYQNIKLPASLSVKLSKEVYIEAQKLKQALIDGYTPSPSTSLAEHRQLQGLKKCDSVAVFVAELLDQNLPVICFAHHKACVAQLKSLLFQYSPLTITGETSSVDRVKAINAFQNGEINLLICNITAGGVGISLQRAQHVVMCELSYSAADNAQAVARARRIGSEKGRVLVYWMSVEGSIDEDIEAIVIRKTRELSEVIDAT